MRTRSLLAALLIAFAAPSLLRADQRDHDLARTVTDAVRKCPHYTIFDDVAVAVSDGTVTLSGEVTTPAKRAGIAADVRRIGGVRTVVDAIAVLPDSSRDADLRRRAAHAIYSHTAFWRYAAMPSPPIHIIVRDGHIRLTGTVSTDVERALAQSLAAETGAFTVKNQLSLTSRHPEPFVEAGTGRPPGAPSV